MRTLLTCLLLLVMPSSFNVVLLIRLLLMLSLSPLFMVFILLVIENPYGRIYFSSLLYKMVIGFRLGILTPFIYTNTGLAVPHQAYTK